MLRATRVVRTVAVAIALCLAAACSSSPTADRATTTVAPATTRTANHTGGQTATSTSTSLALTRAGATYGIGRSDLTLVDRSRNTDGDDKNGIAPKAGRALDTVLLYPTTDSGDDATSDDHPVAPGRFPLVVFSHGVTASGPAYVPVVKEAAAAGFILALPTFPLTAGPDGWGNLGQVVHQPADVSFIIGELLERSADDDDLLGGHLSPDAVAAAGHSLGAITSLFFYNSCCRDDRVKAVVAASGMLLPAQQKADSYDDPPTDVPLLLLHGESDGTVPYDGGSKKVFATFTDVPRALVSFPDTGHTDILTSASLLPSTIAFLNLVLRDDPKQWDDLGAQIGKNGDATIEVAGGLPEPG